MVGKSTSTMYNSDCRPITAGTQITQANRGEGMGLFDKREYDQL